LKIIPNKIAMKSLPGILSFVKAADTGSFTRAAELLDITPAAVSKNVQRLEDQLETRLFNRTTRKLSLTEDGQMFYDRCADAVRDLEAADQALVENHGTPMGLLRVSCGAVFGRMVVAPLLAEFLSRYPQIQVDLLMDDRISDLVAERFDVAIRGGRLPDSGMVAKKIFPLEIGVYASNAYLKRFGEPMSADELSSHNCIQLRFSSTRRLLEWELEYKGEVVTPRISGNLILSDAEAITESCIAGIGIAPISEYLVSAHPQTKQLRRILRDYHFVKRDIFVCYPSRKHAPLKTRVFVDFLVEKLKP
jgi:DNA-binding transcriptional LysR family regulator